MNPSLSEKITSLTNKFKYHAAVLLCEDGPPEKVKAELKKEGWSFKPSMTEEEVKREILGSAFMAPVVYVPTVYTHVTSPDGKDVFGRNAEKDAKLHYKEAVKQAAARVYGISN